MDAFQLSRNLLDGSLRIERVPFEHRTSLLHGANLYRSAFRNLRRDGFNDAYYAALLLLEADWTRLPDSNPMKLILKGMHWEFREDLQRGIECDILGGKIDARDIPFAIRTSEICGRVVYIYTFRIRQYDKDSAQYQEILDLLKGDVERMPHGEGRYSLMDIHETREAFMSSSTMGWNRVEN